MVTDNWNKTEGDSIVVAHNFKNATVSKPEYIITPETRLELKHEKPFYGPDGKIGLVMYPNEMMSNFMSTRHEGFENSVADMYMEAFLELKDGGKNLSPVMLLASNDDKGNVFEEELRLSDSSCKNGLALVKNQIRHVGFETLSALQEDYKKWWKEVEKTPFPFDKPRNNSGSLKPRQSRVAAKETGHER